ncbi:SRPBCC family protein [Saccharothrix syringae]|uniref:Shy6-polyketide cyclase n=1 Tax=Saccharothrix syringae TaxID=103733 RepID=A0A5Q0GXI8_SACSY|nr:SRPBCC family protein [Saccharothrix syringae]QFZ18593.1 Shy6-polyketide cyclase [Saccharothrix syringae]
MEIDRDAAVISRHSITVDAPLEKVWALHTDVAAWPAWQTDITSAALDGPFAPGTSFSWQTYGLDITSTVHEVEPLRRTCWGGPAHGIDGVHVWTFTEIDGAVEVCTEESWDGPAVRADVAAMQAGLDSSLIAWLGRLKAAAES